MIPIWLAAVFGCMGYVLGRASRRRVCSAEPLAFAVLHTDSEYDYRVFGEDLDAQDFADQQDDGDYRPEVIPLYPVKGLPAC